MAAFADGHPHTSVQGSDRGPDAAACGFADVCDHLAAEHLGGLALMRDVRYIAAVLLEKLRRERVTELVGADEHRRVDRSLAGEAELSEQ